MQEEWHHDERKCTFVLLARNLLLLDLDISNDDWPSVAIVPPSHILLPLRCRCTVNFRCPCAVHHRCHRCIAIAPSISVSVAPSIAVAVAPSIAAIAVVSPLCHPSSLPPLRFRPAFHCCRHCAVHHHCRPRCCRAVHHCHCIRVAVAPCIAVAVALSIAIASLLGCRCAFHHHPHCCVAVALSIAVHH